MENKLNQQIEHIKRLEAELNRKDKIISALHETVIIHVGIIKKLRNELSNHLPHSAATAAGV